MARSRAWNNSFIKHKFCQQIQNEYSFKDILHHSLSHASFPPPLVLAGDLICPYWGFAIGKCFIDGVVNVAVSESSNERPRERERWASMQEAYQRGWERLLGEVNL